MRGTLRRRPSGSMVVAFIALLVAMSGTGYAAITLPKKASAPSSSTNAVISSKVKNGSLLRSDFKAGQLPAGRTGARRAPRPRRRHQCHSSSRSGCGRHLNRLLSER